MSWLQGGILSPYNEGGLRLRKGLYLGLPGLAFLFLYVIDFSFDNLQTDVPRALLPFLALVMADILLISEDTLHHSRPGYNRHISFYQAQFPRIYIQQRYNLSAQDARRRWLNVLRQWRDKNNPNHKYFVALLKARLECRAVFYLQRVAIALSLLSFLALIVLAGLSAWNDLNLPSFYSFENNGLTVLRAAFPILLFALYAYLRAVNTPDMENPTGVWLKWKEINDRLKLWWDGNEGMLRV